MARNSFYDGNPDATVTVDTSVAQAAASETAAAASEAAAAISETNAAASYDSFDDRYLGVKSSGPTLDNDGDALVDGALYFDTTTNTMMVYDLGGTTWNRTTPTTSDQTKINTVSGIAANVTTVAGISANVTTVAGISSDVTTVAGKATEIGRLGTADAVADMAILGTTDIVADMAILGTAAVVSDLNTLGTADVVSDLNTLGTADVVTDMNLLATSGNVTNMATLGASGVVSNISTVAGVAANVTTVAGISSDVTTVAGKDTEIGRLGTADAVADMAILGTTDIVADMAILGTADVVQDLNTLGTADVVQDMNTLGTADVVLDMNTLGTSANVTAMNTLGTSANVTAMDTCASNITGINSFADRYRVSTTAPTTSLDEGDLYFNTTDNKMYRYNGTSWAEIVTYTGGTGINISASNVISASSIALTTVQTAASQVLMLALTAQEGDVVVRTDEKKTYVKNSGSAGTMADFTLLETPTDAVTSVDGATGVVTLNHDTLTGFVANEHLDWTTDQGSNNVHADNYTDTVYTHPNHSGDIVSTGDGATTIQAGAVDIAMLSATGTASSTTFLRGDNTWVVPTDTDTNTNQLTTFTVSATTDTTPTTISQGDDLLFTAGTGITCETTADGTVTITNTVTDTDTVYTHPTTAGNKHVPTGGSSGQFLKYDSSGTAVWAADNDTVYTHPTGAGNEHLPSAVSQTEAGYLNGVTSDIQTQLDAKVAKTASTGSAALPTGTTAQRDGTPTAGYMRYNSTTASFEGYGSAWGSIGGGATGAGGDAVFVENELIVTTDYTLSTNKSAMSVGPVTVNSGVSVTIPSGHTWVVL